jgi:hypothetical protein
MRSETGLLKGIVLTITVLALPGVVLAQSHAGAPENMPESPKSYENNWVETIPGKSWFVILRMYSPLQPWIDQTWRPSEIELVE